MLNKFGNLGFTVVVIRDGISELKKGNLQSLEKLKYNSYTGEFILSITLVFVGFISSLFFSSSVVKIAIIRASIGLFTSKMFGLIQTELKLYKKFGSISKLLIIQGVLNSVFVILTVPYFEIFSVLAIPVLTTSFVIYYSLKIGIFLNFNLIKKNLKKFSKLVFL